MEEFDKYKEVKYISIWFLIISAVIGIAIFLKIESSIAIYIIIIVILLVYSYLKSKEAEHYKNQVLKLEKKENDKNTR